MSNSPESPGDDSWAEYGRYWAIELRILMAT